MKYFQTKNYSLVNFGFLIIGMGYCVLSTNGFHEEQNLIIILATLIPPPSWCDLFVCPSLRLVCIYFVCRGRNHWGCVKASWTIEWQAHWILRSSHGLQWFFFLLPLLFLYAFNHSKNTEHKISLFLYCSFMLTVFWCKYSPIEIH